MEQLVRLLIETTKEKSAEFICLQQVNCIAKLLNIHLRSLIHFSTRVFSLLGKNLFDEFIGLTVSFLIQMNEIKDFMHMKRIHLSASFEDIMHSLVLATSFLSFIHYEASHPFVWSLFEFAMEILIKDILEDQNSQANEGLFSFVENLFQINPAVLQTHHLDKLSGFCKKVKEDTFIQLVSMLTLFATNEHAREEEFRNSCIFNNLQFIPSILSSREFLSPEFYKDDKVTVIHACFLKLLKLVEALILKLKKDSFLFDKVHQFFGCYWLRIEMILSLNSDPKIIAHKEQEISASFKSYAVLEELLAILKIVSFLSEYVFQWKNESQAESERVYFLVFNRVIKIFSQEIFQSKVNFT